MISIESLTKSYGAFDAVKDISLEIPDGQFTVLLGPSGSGKTTLLRMLNRMIVPSSGRVLIDGVDTSTVAPEQLRRTMGYVIQSTGLFPNMSVHRNVATVPRLLKWDRSRTDARVSEMLSLVGLDPAVYADKRPEQLSGGEAQRVGVARALAADPPILLMDEPFGAVDPLTRERLQLELKRLHAQLGKTIVFVTHDIDEAVLLADRIAVLRAGRIEQSGSPEQLWRAPATQFLRDFFGPELGLRITSRHDLHGVKLATAGPGDGELPRVGVAGTIKDALALMVDSRTDRIAVTDGGAVLGVADFTTLVTAAGLGNGDTDA